MPNSIVRNGKRCATAAANAACTNSKTMKPGISIRPTSACKLLDRRSAQCSNYKHRHAFVPDCIRLTPAKLATMDWLPPSCAYVLRAAGKPLPDWHYLNSGDRDSVHAAGQSVRGWTISEIDAGDLELHLVDRDDL